MAGEEKKNSALISSTFELHILTFNKVRLFYFSGVRTPPPTKLTKIEITPDDHWILTNSLRAHTYCIQLALRKTVVFCNLNRFKEQSASAIADTVKNVG